MSPQDVVSDKSSLGRGRCQDLLRIQFMCHYNICYDMFINCGTKPLLYRDGMENLEDFDGTDYDDLLVA